MELSRRKMCCYMQFCCFVLIGCFISQICASSDAIFYEPFDESFEGSWIVSEKEDYSGEWKHSKSEGHDDYGLLVSDKARKYAIVKELEKPVELKDGTIVLQYEVRLQNGLECGGAYLKYLRPQEAGWTAKGFDNESPYSIMFGPDKCGATNKVHFILKHKNPKSGEYVEHHLKFPPSVPSDKLTHVYTAVIKPEKPEGWLDDEPEEIDDPEAVKPEDWDDEEDGEWEAPQIENPKCESAPGCGEWRRPLKRNPAYKGKWHAPLIDNPAYKGIWKPREIPNPDYFELEKPNFEPIAAIGIEIWTMQDGILFDSILIASDGKTAAEIRDTTWKPKFKVEEEKQKAEEKSAGLDGLKGIQKAVFDVLYKIADLPFLGDHKVKVLELIEKAETQPNFTIGVIVSIIVVIFSILLKLLFGGKKAAPKVNVVPEKKEEGEASNTAEGEGEGEGEEEKTEGEVAAAPRRRTRRDT
ncbi:putative calreticulin/calnexin, concanavalin A-like lectin/glucanase domain superfamily [Helianthus annuus]|nr:putative calreticulin/calnexin, concanavalin A-like lectin/glucanase domain superfamily [Helianthus annuus]